jgi:8-oxo-dGTP diphosphatase
VSEPVRAAGAVVWRAGGDGTEVAVVHRQKYDDWTLPKGKAEPREALPVCAVREVREETGFHGSLGRALGQTHYVTTASGSPRPKVVHYWALRATTGSFVPNDEVDELRWLTVSEARRQLSYERDRDPMDAFSGLPAETSTVLLVRHASAGDPGASPAGDALRRLDDTGMLQAGAVSDVLPCWGVERVLSADILRCEQTVTPLASRLGLPVVADPLFSEEGYWRARDQAYARLEALGAEGRSTVVCSQGGVIPDLTARALSAAGLQHPAAGTARKASVWALSYAAGCLVDVDYLPQLLA